ncbi:hypothetical protein PRK78_002080 [Emydomyces testavorans]|uniref:Swi5-domain-containing protein n=1 Tax=Emydomyces testavorans TaxID=2070801 RepID=A0AAF0DFP2_9EURO|nr:hypothetical protein PRK78_002080 [Emydomyces testavorans]
MLLLEAGEKYKYITPVGPSDINTPPPQNYLVRTRFPKFYWHLVNGPYRSIRPAGTSPPDPASIVKRHIRLLHEYNEIKDVGQGLLGLIAEGRGVRYVDVQREFGVGGSD